MVAVDFIADRRTLFHHEKPLFPTAKRAKVELGRSPLDGTCEGVWINLYLHDTATPIPILAFADYDVRGIPRDRRVTKSPRNLEALRAGADIVARFVL
jgi:hypothetical protein